MTDPALLEIALFDAAVGVFTAHRPSSAAQPGLSPIVNIWPFVNIWLGYWLLIAIPGPNMLLVGTRSACRGFPAILPIVLGIGAGASILAATIHIVVAKAIESDTLQDLIAIGGAILMALVAWRMVQLSPASPAATCASPTSTGADFVLGLGCGLCNPLTASYFAARIARDSDDLSGEFSTVLLSAGVLTLATLTLLSVAFVMSRGHVRVWVTDRLRPIQFFAASLILIMAIGTGWSAAHKMMPPI